MNKMIILLLLTMTTAAWGLTSMEDCQQDAELFANHKKPVKPHEECADLIKEHPLRVEVKSADGKYHLFGFGKMFYLDGHEERMLMAGDQTALKDIKKAWIDTANRRIFILQHDSLSTFDLDFIGNVAPLKLVRDSILRNLIKVELLPKENRMIITSDSGAVHKINADAESRKLSAKKPLAFYPY